jgi:hypothetical protein
MADMTLFIAKGGACKCRKPKYENMTPEEKDRLDAERAFVSCVIHNENVLETRDLWIGHHFIDWRNKVVFEAARALKERRALVCADSVKELLGLAAYGGYVDFIFDIVPSSANVDYYAKAMI